jgi:hypothetical protein
MHCIDDKEWKEVLAEASTFKRCPELRKLFVTILIYNSPSDPKALFDAFAYDFSEDKIYQRRHQIGNDESNEGLLDEDINECLQDLDTLIQEMSDGKDTVMSLLGVEVRERRILQVYNLYADEMAYDRAQETEYAINR